ncbi:MAG: hypothetical protein AB7E05_12505 [Sphingobium sp.]
MAIRTEGGAQGAVREYFQPLCEEPLWTEYLYFFAIDEGTQRAISIHVGRCVGDLDRWRASIVAYLADDGLAVAMVEGQGWTDRRLEIGGLVIDIVEDARLWRVAFTGVARTVRRRDTMRGLARDGGEVALTFDLAFGGVVPLWDLRSSIGDAESYSRMHHQQVGRAIGSFACGEAAISFSGMCVRDHSSGPRNYALVEGDFWISVLFPSGRAIMAQAVKLANSMTNAAYLATPGADVLALGTVITHPAVPSADAAPGSFPADPMDGDDARDMEIVVEIGGRTHSMRGDLLHAAALTFYPPASEEIGTDFDTAGVLQWTESLIKVRYDGETGYGVRERIAPVAILARPE